MGGVRMLHFAAGSRRLALPLAEVREIAEIRNLTSVPGAPAIVGGLTEIRGRVVTLLDPSAEDGSPQGPAIMERSGAPLFAVIFAEPFDHLGVLIRGIPETANARDESGITGYASPPAGPRQDADDDALLSAGGEIALPEGRSALLLDPKRLAAHASRCVRAQFRVAMTGR